MNEQKILVFMLLAVPAIFANDRKYCDLEACPNGSHTLCKYPIMGAASTCTDVKDRRLDFWEKKIILNAFDRNLKWDETLARSAQRWADQCQLEKDTCRHLHKHEVRQRVADLDDVDYQDLSDSEEDELPIYYQTLLDWQIEDAQSLQTETIIGCGKMKAIFSKKLKLFIVCNFGKVKDPSATVNPVRTDYEPIAQTNK